MERTPTPFQSLGAGLGQGLSQGINYGIQDMLQQKSNSRQIKSLLALLGPDVTKSLGLSDADIDKFSGLDPKLFMSVIDAKRQQMSLNDLSTSRMNSPLNKQYEEEFRQQAAQTPRNLSPGIAPMLEYQDIPAEEEAPIAKPSPIRMQSTRQEPEFKNIPYEDKKRQIEDYWNNLISSKPQVGAEKYIAAKEKDLNNLRRDEELAQKVRSTDIKAGSEEYRRHQDVIKRNEDISRPYLNDITKREKTAAGQDMALKSAEDAVRSGKTEGAIPYLAQKFNILPGQTTNSAILNAAAKEFLFTNVTRAGSRPNMWLEQQVRSMFPQVGQNKEGALSDLEMIRNDNAVVQEEAKIARQLQDEYKQKGLDYTPSEIEQRVNEKLIPFINARKEILASRLKEIQEEKYSDSDLDRMVQKKVTKGTPLTDRMSEAILRAAKGNTKKAALVAKRLGYEFPEE